MPNKQAIVFDIKGNIEPIKQSALQLRQIFDKMDLSDNIKKSFLSTFSKLDKELRAFEVKGNNGFEKITDTKNAIKNVQNIIDCFEDLKIQAKDVSNFKIDKIVSSNTVQSLKKYQKTLEQLEALQKKDNTSAIAKAQDALTKALDKQSQAQKKVAEAQSKANINDDKIKTAQSEVQRLTNELKKLNKEQVDLAKIPKNQRTAEQQTQYQLVTADINAYTKALTKQKSILLSSKNEADKLIQGLYDTEAAEQAASVKVKELSDNLEKLKNSSAYSDVELKQLQQAIYELTNTPIDKLPKDLEGLKRVLEQLGTPEKILEQILQDISSLQQVGSQGAQGAKAAGDALRKISDEQQGIAAVNSEMDMLKSRLTYFFSAMNGIQLFKNAIRDAYESVKELDAAITEMAVVTDYSINDIWGNISQYTQTAVELGATTKDVINSMVLYTQQGLNMSQATELSTQTMKMARIAGLEGAEATDLMTAALRGFNMELNEVSAQRVNDVYSNLAANAAANTQEIADAMTRTASIANAAGMEFETTAAFLTQMIETTRESAENLGTAMKTIVARFTEMKKAPTGIAEVEGEEVNVNKVEAALKSVGVQLRDTTGEFRDLDDVFLELSSKWDSLDKMSQRYVATTAAGSRQQSRFIAMMSNYQRTMELTGYAINSAGASQRQFEKTMDSLESKLNRLHDAWEQFTTGIANQSIIKGVVDLLTNLLTTINNVTDALDPFHSGWSKILAAFLGFKGAKAIVNNTLKSIGTSMVSGMSINGQRMAETTHKNFTKKIFSLFKKQTWTGTENAVAPKELIAAKQLAETRRLASNAANYNLKTEKENLIVLQAQAEAAEREARAKSEEAIRKARDFGSSSSAAQFARRQAEDANTAAINANSVAKVQNEKVTEARQRAEKADAIATEANTAAQEMENNAGKVGLLTKIKSLSALFGMNNAKKAAMLQTWGLASAEEAEAMVSMGAAGAQSTLNAAIMACPIGWILAGIAAVVAAVAIFANVHETTAEKVERLNKTVEELGTQMNETQEAVNDLTDSWDKLDSLNKELDELTVGTTEWKQKLVEVNQEVLNLLDKYPKLAEYVSSNNGKLEIDKSGYDLVLNAQIEGLKTQQASYAFGQALAGDMEKRQISERQWHTAGTARQQLANEELSKDIETRGYLSTGTSAMVDKFAEEQEKLGNTLTEEQKILSASLITNRKTLENFEQIKYNTSVDTELYAKIVGLSKEEVEEKRKNNQLSDDAIRNTIASNKLQEKYSQNLEKLVKLTESDKLSGTIKRLISGNNTLTEEDVKNKRDNKTVEEVFKDYLENGIVNIDTEDNDKVRDLIQQYYGINSNEIKQLEDLGASLEDIVQNIVDSTESALEAQEQLANLDASAIESYNKLKNFLQQEYGDLTTAQLKQISSVFNKISSQGGNLEAFSEQIQQVITKLKNPKDLDNFINSLSSVDFSSETKIREFSDGLSDLGINLTDKVENELIRCTNAARDFDLSKVTNQLINRELAADIEERIGEKNNIFSADDFEKYQTELTASGREDLLEQFKHFGNEYIYTGDLEEIKGVLEKLDTLEDIKKILSADEKNETDVRKRYNNLVARGTTPAYDTKVESTAKTIWEEYTLDDLLVDRSGNKLEIDLTSQTGKTANYLNSLLYAYTESGETVKDQDLNPVIDENKVVKIYKKALEDEDFAKLLPKEFFTKVEEEFSKNTGSTFARSLRAAQGEFLGLPGGDDASNKQVSDSLLKYAEKGGWNSDTVLQNEKFLKQWQKELGKDNLGNYILSNEQIEQFKVLTANEISKKLKELGVDISEQTEAERANLAQTEADYITTLTSAREILEYEPETGQGKQARADAIDALVKKHKDYEVSLRQLMDAEGLEEEEAKSVLAVRYEQNEILENIKSNISDYKDSLTSPELKGTQQYNEAIATLTSQFQEIFGENITSDWVERNLNDIVQLSEGTVEEAQAAYKRLLDTEEAELKKISAPIKINLDDNEAYQKIVTFFDKISEVAEESETNTTKVKDSLSSVQEILDELDKSDATIEVKAQTRDAVAELLRVGLVDAISTNNPSKFQALVNFAQANGFATSGLSKVINTSYSDGKLTYTFSKNAKDYSSNIDVADFIQDPKTGEWRKKTQDERIASQYKNVEIDNPGPNITLGNQNDSKEDKTSTKEDTWENDWDRQYDTLKRIEALERKRNNLNKELDRYLKKGLFNEQKIFEMKEKQRKNLTKQIELNQKLARDADSWLRGLNNDGQFDGTIWWDEAGETIRTNDARIRAMDEETKKSFDKIKDEYEFYYNQRNTALDNIDSAVDAIEELTEAVTELDYHNNTERLISVIEKTIDLYDKAAKRLEWTERSVSSQDIMALYDARNKEAVEKFRVLTDDFIQTEAEINAMLYKSNYQKYYQADWKTGKVTTTGAFDALTDKTSKDMVREFVDKLSDLFQRRNDTDSQRIEIQEDIRNNQREYLDKAEEFNKNVYDAVVSQREAEISKLENINSSIQNAASDLVSSIQKNIQKIRQDRTNKKTEEELYKMQSKLDFLRMDTSSGNQKTILDLRKQLEDKEQSYTDSLIDQKISELQDQNAEAEKQRKQQIEIMKTQLDVQKDNGLIWNDVRYLIANGLSQNGNIREGSDLDRALKEWGKYSSLSTQGQKDWLHTQNVGASTYDAYYNLGIKQKDYNQQLDYSAASAKTNYNTMQQNMVNAYKQGLVEGINNTTPYKDYMRYDYNSNKMIQTQLFPNPNQDKAQHDLLENAWKQAWDTINTINNIDAYFKKNKGSNIIFTQVPAIARFATGGIADFTGPAWLDGTKTSPELVLNAKDTENFIQLKDILSSIMNGKTIKTDSNGDCYFEIHIDVDKISNDYDVDRMAERIKQQIVNSARYRNVNTINLLR